MVRRVVVVEDVDVCAATLEIALHRLPELIVHTAHSAEEALRVLSQAAISALITDLHLPGMDGFELIERVRAQPKFKDLPILVISGDSDPATAVRLQSLGATAYFPKPYSPAEVRQKLEQLIYV